MQVTTLLKAAVSAGTFLNLLMVNGFDTQTKLDTTEFTVVDNYVNCVVQLSFYSAGDFVHATGLFDASTAMRQAVGYFANIETDKVSGC